MSFSTIAFLCLGLAMCHGASVVKRQVGAGPVAGMGLGPGFRVGAGPLVPPVDPFAGLLAGQPTPTPMSMADGGEGRELSDMPPGTTGTNPMRNLLRSFLLNSPGLVNPPLVNPPLIFPGLAAPRAAPRTTPNMEDFGEPSELGDGLNRRTAATTNPGTMAANPRTQNVAALMARLLSLLQQNTPGASVRRNPEPAPPAPPQVPNPLGTPVFQGAPLTSQTGSTVPAGQSSVYIVRGAQFTP